MKKDDKVLLFLGAFILTVVLGGMALYNIIDYEPPQPSTPLDPLQAILVCLLILSIGLAVGIAIHGFHPILLVKNKTETIVNPLKEGEEE